MSSDDNTPIACGHAYRHGLRRPPARARRLILGPGSRGAVALLACSTAIAVPDGSDPRLREIVYEAHSVVTVPVRRGLVTLLMLDPDESITEVGTGIGSDCARPESAWCIAAQPGGRTLFIKPKTMASTANNLAVVTSRRVHNFRLQVLADEDPKASLYRLVVKAPAPAVAAARPPAQPSGSGWLIPQLQLPQPPAPHQLVSERLQAKPAVRNTRYSLAEGRHSEDIVPTLVFDDGRFTYLRFPGSREVPAVFQVLGDGSEALVNARMEDDLLVVDRVSRRLVLRAGAAVVAIWNEAFDLEGVPTEESVTVPGVRRVLKAADGELAPPATDSKGVAP